MIRFLLMLLILLLIVVQGTKAYDVVIYGATSGGVVAAVAAARKQLQVALIEPIQSHIGGMTSSGLGWTDIGDSSTIAGITHELYVNIGKHYKGENNSDPQYAFAPSVAEAAFINLTATIPKVYSITILLGTVLNSVTIVDGSITSAQFTRNGASFEVTAKMFIDATYEGDLMAAANVTYALGRESTSEYGESFAGVQNVDAVAKLVDPYVQPGNSSSGLIQGIQGTHLQEKGSADNLIQAYNFRLCLTTDKDLFSPIKKPITYDPAQFEFHARWIAAMNVTSLDSILKLTALPNHKTDVNNGGDVSTDFIGASYTYAESNWKERSLIIGAHQAYTLGFLWFLGNDDRVPAIIKNQMLKWGWCNDEFVDNNYFPFQLYIRESRRMIGEYVMTEHDTSQDGKYPPISDGIAVGSYTYDCHSTQRVALTNWNSTGQVWIKEEGGPSPKSTPKPYPISYRALIPKSKTVSNLLVPICLSASHVAYMTIRMEPVYMQLSQAAATAAYLAISSNRTVQNIDVKTLQTILKADGCHVEWPPSSIF